MTHTSQTHHLPTLLAALRQNQLDGELVLEQNDGYRRMYWQKGELVYLQSDAAGEQFGNYLLRRGILDYSGLNQLLASDERSRLGEKVIQTGLMTVDERDAHLRQLQEQVMINALEHPILHLEWHPESSNERLSEDLHLKLDHRHFIWNTFLEAHNLQATVEQLQACTDWRWEGIPGLLEAVSDLPLNPATAYALSFLGCEPISYDTFLSLSGLHEDDAARIFLVLWAVGALSLTQGEPPRLPAPPSPPDPLLPPLPEVPRTGTPEIELDLEPDSAGPVVPEFLDPEPEAPAPGPGAPTSTQRARALTRKAKSFQLQERIGEAIHCLELSVQLDPDSEYAYETWNLLGNLRMSNPAWSTRSINAFQAATRIQPKSAEPWVGMGVVYYRKGFRTNAVACFHKALELDPSSPIPPEVDYRDLEAELPPEPSSQPKSLFSRFKSVLGGTEKS